MIEKKQQHRFLLNFLSQISVHHNKTKPMKNAWLLLSQPTLYIQVKVIQVKEISSDTRKVHTTEKKLNGKKNEIASGVLFCFFFCYGLDEKEKEEFVQLVHYPPGF